MSATIKNVVKIAPKPILNSPGTTAGSSNATAGSKIGKKFSDPGSCGNVQVRNL